MRLTLLLKRIRLRLQRQGFACTHQIHFSGRQAGENFRKPESPENSDCAKRQTGNRRLSA